MNQIALFSPPPRPRIPWWIPADDDLPPFQRLFSRTTLDRIHANRKDQIMNLDGNDPSYGYDPNYEAALTRLYADLGISPVDGSNLDQIVTSDDKAEAWERFYAATGGA